MKSAIRQKLEQIAFRLEEVDAFLSSEDAARDMRAFRRLSLERAEIEPAARLYARYRQIEADLRQAEVMRSDPELRALAEEEIAAAKAGLPELELELQKRLLPRDPDDRRDILLEIRAGTGGDESALFAGELFRMYSRYAERQGWRVEILSANAPELGGYREIICRVTGADVYARLKFESGAHRVQRVPETETQGRIHTSACTVAVMPEANEMEAVELNPAELRVDTFRAAGAGGQHINKTDSAVRVTHLPTGIVAECQDGRSQHQNKVSAMKVLAARIRDAETRARQAREAATRKTLVGSGDRSERIRTYNFPQGRVTDHRVNLTLHKIAAIMEGDLDEIINALAAEHQMEQLVRYQESVIHDPGSEWSRSCQPRGH
ncbi:MAG: peptide chain release factor 1 [Zoogloeaceae bacterium]|jgi:peptide chain release factor 1|nr:peptide chain release factor 1 [Zoogloeaceae bacterium]